jgi:hypothetical protein
VGDNPAVKEKTSSRFGGLSPNRFAIGLAVVLALVNLALLAVSLNQRGNIGSLRAEAQEMNDNLSQLQRAEAEGLRSLEGDLAAARDELESLKASFPEIGGGFDVYSRGFELATAAGAQLNVIRRMGTSTQSTVAGDLQITSYHLQSSASMQACLAFLSSLEKEGLDTVALSSIQINPSRQGCSFDLDIASIGGSGGSDG